jgi:hypothetical protein
MSQGHRAQRIVITVRQIRRVSARVGTGIFKLSEKEKIMKRETLQNRDFY